MLRYPVYPDNDNTNVLTISLSDINRLKPDQDSNGTDMYLSDTIADFCISYMQSNSTPSSRKGVFITSCLFYSHLKPLAINGDISSAWYTRNGKLDAINSIVIPIVTDEHFSTIVVTGIWRNDPVFYHYDSLVNYHSTHDIIELIADYVKELRRPKNGEIYSSLLSIDPSRVIKLKGPIQGNKFDCGVFMLKFIQNVLESSTISLDSCLDSFNSTTWSCQDVRDYRIAMYDVVIRLFDENVGNQNMIATQNIVRDIEESRYSTKHKELKVSKDVGKKVSIDTYILETFGTMDNYIRLVPNVNDQDYIRLMYNQNQFLLDTFNAKRRTINCGVYRGEFIILSRYHFLPALSWVPNNVNCWDRIPVSYDRYPNYMDISTSLHLKGLTRRRFFLHLHLVPRMMVIGIFCGFAI